jgi:hypothetical protein
MDVHFSIGLAAYKQKCLHLHGGIFQPTAVTASGIQPAITLPLFKKSGKTVIPFLAKSLFQILGFGLNCAFCPAE